MKTAEAAYRQFHVRLRSSISRRLGAAEDADDVLQEVFVRVARNEAALAAATQPMAWLYTVTKSAIADHHRRQSRNPLARAGELPDLPSLPTGPEPKGDFGDCLLPLLKALPDKYREAVTFVDLGGERQVDLAVRVGLSPSAAKSRVQRGRQMLKAAVLDCCQIGRDGQQRVTSLVRGQNSRDCC